jgi:tetratricopeptide (TPR) repeat protein
MKWRETFASWLKPDELSGRAPNAADFDAGLAAMRAGDADAALEAFLRAEQAAATQTEKASIGRLRVQTLLRAGRRDEAAALAHSLRALGNTGSAAAHWRIAEGQIAADHGDAAAARDQYEAAESAARTASNGALQALASAFQAEVYLSESNAGYAARLLRAALPRLAAAGDIEHVGLFTGILGLALLQAGQEGEGAALIGRALETADLIGDRLRVRRWSLALAERALAEARYYDAQTHLRRALERFDPAMPSPESITCQCDAARAALALGEHDEAIRHGEAALAGALALQQPALLAKAQTALGITLRTCGQPAQALPHLRAAASGPQPSLEAVRHLAITLAELGELAESTTLFERVIHERAGTFDEAIARRDLGLALSRAGELQAAISAWMPAISLSVQANAPALAARLYCEIASARQALGQPLRALREIEAALMLLTKLAEHDSDTRGLVLASAAAAFAESGDADSADAFFNEAIAIAAKAGDRATESLRSGNYGWFLTLVGRPRRAISLLERAIQQSEALGLQLQRAVQLDNLGLAYDALNDLPTALAQHRAALAAAEPLEHPAWTASIRASLAHTLIAAGEMDEAAALTAQVLESARSLNDNALLIRALSLNAALALRRGDAPSADLREAISLARRMEARRLLAEALALESERAAATGDAAGARTAWAEAARLYAMLHMPQAKLTPSWLAQSGP